jgi:hypothetical protein
MNRSKAIKFFVSLFLLVQGASVHAQHKDELIEGHTTIAILPAFYFDRTETSTFGEDARKLKLLQQFKKEIGIDVQYKFYLPVMQGQEKYGVFFRGADTINKILDSNSISFVNYESISNIINYKKLAEILNVDAVIILELTEANAYTNGNIATYFLNFFYSSPALLDKMLTAMDFTKMMNNQTVSLTLTAKIYDCKTGTLVWDKSSKIKNKYYHDAVREMTDLLLKKIPYRLNKKWKY